MEGGRPTEGQIKRDIPPLGRYGVIHATEWGEKWAFPSNDIPAADYYVTYSHAKGFGTNALVAASHRNLATDRAQLESTADFCHDNNIHVDNYFIVIDRINRRDKKKFKLVDYENEPALKILHRKTGETGLTQDLIHNKPIFVMYRKDFERLK